MAGELHYRTGEYKLAVAALRGKRPAARVEGIVNEWRVRDRLARSLLRLNRPAEARAALRPTDTKIPHNQLLDVAISAASGGVALTERELDELIRMGQATPEGIHADPDLGPALKTPPFKRLLE